MMFSEPTLGPQPLSFEAHMKILFIIKWSGMKILDEDTFAHQTAR